MIDIALDLSFISQYFLPFLVILFIEVQFDLLVPNLETCFVEHASQEEIDRSCIHLLQEDFLRILLCQLFILLVLVSDLSDSILSH